MKVLVNWKIFTGFSYSFNQDDITGGLYNTNKDQVQLKGLEFKNFTQVNKGYYFNGKMVVERRLKGLSAFRFGGEYNSLDDATDYTAYNNQLFQQEIKQHINALFAETDIYITNDLAAKIGGRYEYSSLLDKSKYCPEDITGV